MLAFSRSLLRTLCALLLCAGTAVAQGGPHEESLTVTKIDPPNWFSQFPHQPLLLLRGTGLTGARFTLRDAQVSVTASHVSDNGHWATLTLSRSPSEARSVTLTIDKGNHSLHLPYVFQRPRAANSGMSGFSQRDVLYLILTDRFADGDHSNDGPDGKSSFADPVAAAERARPRGWHGGDLRGVLQHLDYLQQLGVTAVWLTPVTANSGRDGYHGYHATDQYSVDPHLGNLADLQALAAALHRRGMKLVLDTVPNHVGPSHPWVHDEPSPNWFHGTASNHLSAGYDFAALINPHAPERDRETTEHGWFANSLPDMDTEDPTVATYLRQNTLWWIEQTGADALRIDTFAFVNREFWRDFHKDLGALFPHLTDVGEIFDPGPEITSSFAGGITRAGVDTGLYTPFDFPTFFAARGVFGEGKPMTDLTRVLGADALYPHPERLVPFLGNHDTTRFATAVPDPTARQLAVTYLFTTRGMPQLYAGDEIALEGGGDPENRRDFPGGFTPDGAVDAFSPAGRDATQQTSWTWWQHMIALRRAHGPLACGTEQVLASGPDLLVYARLGTSACKETAATESASPERADVVLLQRGTLKPISVDLHNTDLEGCRPAQPILGSARVDQQTSTWTITPTTAEVILPCS